jgi:hypothetical protein
VNAFQDTYHPGSQANCFLTKLDTALKKMAYSTFAGGGSNHAADSANGSSIKTIRAKGTTAYFIISSQDNDFPLGDDGVSIMGNPLLVGFNIWPMSCAYGCAMSPPVWSRVIVGQISKDGDYQATNFGGYQPESSSGALAVDDNGVYIGARCKPGGPLLWATVYGSYRTTTIATNQSWFDGAAAKLNSNLRSPVWSSYLGGHGQNDFVSAVVDAGCLILLGKTKATDYPTKNPIQSKNAGDYDWTITKINGNGSALDFSTYLGSKGGDDPVEIRIDEQKRLWIVGQMSGKPTLVRISADLKRVEENRQIGNGEVRCLALGEGCLVYAVKEGNGSRIVKEMR